MRIVQIVLPGASEYERKSQRADRAALAERHDVELRTVEAITAADADIAHVYASGDLPSAAFVGFPLPYVSSAAIAPSRWWRWRRPVQPRSILSPLGDHPLPEVVEERYFSAQNTSTARDPSLKIVGSFGRPSVRNSVEQAMARIRRFREDVEWQIFDGPPSPEDLAGVDLWVDPAVDENDFDGFVAEALVVGLPIVATRTAINVLRLEQGRTGFLTPPRDPNEMTHAILAGLFKTEVALSRQSAARQTVSKYRARQRLRFLTRIYESLVTNRP
jgi:glycosyltransferase involved in cell wall biosynthesis